MTGRRLHVAPWDLLLAQLVEEDLGADRSFPGLLHGVKEEEHGRRQGLWAGQRHRQQTLETIEIQKLENDDIL